MTAEDQRVLRLKEQLQALEARFDAEARRRGFDPAQAENMALPSKLAVLLAECEEIKTELEELAADSSRETEGSREQHAE